MQRLRLKKKGGKVKSFMISRKRLDSLVFACYNNSVVIRMSDKSFNLGLVVGRFEPIHLGHEKLIDIALRACRKTALLVTYNEPDKNNPFSSDYIMHLIHKIYADQIKNGELQVIPFKNDIAFDEKYGEKILATVKGHFSENPDFIVYGSDKNISKCFCRDAVKRLFEVKVNRDDFHISATDIREALSENNIEFVKKYIDPKIHDEISYMKYYNDKI